MRNSLPSRDKIKAYWWRELILLGKFHSKDEFFAAEFCFACGLLWDGKYAQCLEKAHIIAHCDGGTEAPDNLHLLCPTCHHDSEGLCGPDYWTWFIERGPLRALVSYAMRRSDGRSHILKYLFNPLGLRRREALRP